MHLPYFTALVLPAEDPIPSRNVNPGAGVDKAAMETLEAYLDRKHEELTLLNGFLGTPLALRHPVSVVDVIEQKFHVAAALKAEHALHDWALTETAWAHQGRLRAGPFEFSYDYQRADLEVRGPSFYQFDSSAAANETIYGETLELIESHVRQLRLVRLKSSPREVASGAGRLRILLFDSCTPAAAFDAMPCGCSAARRCRRISRPTSERKPTGR